MIRKETLLNLGVAAIAGLIGGSLSSSMMSGSIARADKSQAISASKFSLVDADGKERGSFSVDGEGMASLTVLSKSGEPRGVFGAGADGLTVLNLSHQGKLRAQIRTAAGGAPNLELWGENGEPVFQAPK